MSKEVTIIKADGTKELFRSQKLRDSLARAGASVEEINNVLSHIEAELIDGMTTREIYRHAFDFLKEQDVSAAGQYSLREAILQLGPTGFPFEEFVAELFRRRGYEAHTGDNVPGRCVPHEVDVIACKQEEELIMAETKFHNMYGAKSDIQDALYTKARFDDIQGGKFQYYGCSTLHEGWLITNTKFSHQAIQYGQCVGMKMLGWNFPQNAGLEMWICEAKLIPVTALTTLSQKQKRLLLDDGVITNDELKKRPDALKALGLNDAQMKATFSEVEMIS